MNFFDAQDQARRASRRLVVAYLIATAFIVAGVSIIATVAIFGFTDAGYDRSLRSFFANNWAIPALAALVTTLVIVGSSMFKTAVLSSGGGAVARQLGGTQVSTDVQDPLRRRLRNVVEEMAIASGVPVPEIYVLEQESSINAFAAGFSPSDAAIAVTRGTLEMLDRNELQGVIAHEFSHVLNGDMRLNIRLMGVLFGIMVLALIGRMILRGGRYSGVGSSRRGNGVAVVLIIGLGLTILGWIGMFAARIIKAGVSRQREYLADASAVQFTRQTEGIANALKKIGGYSHGSLIEATDPEEVSHMLFGSGAKFAGVFATHPPLVERIQALDPNFTASDFPRIDERQERQRIRATAAASGFAPTAAVASAELPERMVETVGQPEAQHIEYAREIRGSIPSSLYDAAHSREFAYLLAIALVVDPKGDHTERQLALVRDQVGTRRADIVRRLYTEIVESGTEYRLPLLGISFPALKQRPAAELGYLLELTTRLIEIDGDFDLYEYCFHRFLTTNLSRASHPAAKNRQVGRKQLRAAAVNLLRILADYGHEDDAARRAAFAAGIGTLGKWAAEYDFEADRTFTISVLDHSLDVLLALNTKGKESLLRAIGATATHDNHVSVTEAELIRAVCASLDYPLPPILADQ
jgi:Zn-dependent protease with chaperone function